MNYKVNDTIVLIEDIPKYNLYIGELGVIIMEFDTPNKAYEIEFVNIDGSIKATVVLDTNKFKKN